jgi:transposase
VSDNAPPKLSYEELERRVAKLEAEITRLTKALEEAQRARKRQAGPFSKGPPKPNPKKPGRKSGDEYGEQASRPEPPQVDEVLEAPLPSCCPDCGGAIEETHIDEQVQTDVPLPRPRVTKIQIHCGRCDQCGRTVRARHARQTSNAVGAAANQIGPNALALAAQMNKELGLTYGKIATFFEHAFGLKLARATLARAVIRVGKLAEPAYDRAIELVRQSFAVYPDETGWRVAGLLQWLWVFVAPGATVYRIRPSRGFDVAADVLGKDYDGTIGCDGWSIYLQFLAATRQTCNAHLLRRCRELLDVAVGRSVCFPQAVKALLQNGLELRDRLAAGTIGSTAFVAARDELEARLGQLFRWDLRDEPNRIFQDHLANHVDEIFTYLYDPAIEATSWPADHAIRGVTVMRKISGGNRSEQGAHAHEVLLSFFRTCWQRGLDAINLTRELLTSPRPHAFAHAIFR